MNDKTGKALIWDLPTRVFHWLLVLSFALAWLSFDDNRFLFVHVFSGYVFFALLVFRLAWGVVGTHYARFHAFAYDWTSVYAYLKGLLNGQAMRHIGHNPAGGWAIFLMLILGFAVSVAGILTLAGEEGHGPLRQLVSYAVGIRSHGLHEVLAWVMLVLTVLHVLGVVGESIYHRDNLIWSMVTGVKVRVEGMPGVFRHSLIGVLLLVLLAVSALSYFRGYLIETADGLYQPYHGPVLSDNALWREACGECHFAFHPSLLPQRSWRALFEGQHEHFEDDLDLDEADYAELLTFHLSNAAEKGQTEPARKINFYTSADETPLRVTKTPYWIDKHADIASIYWDSEVVGNKGNCEACHLDAEEGTYEDSSMRLPNIEQELVGKNNE